MKDNFILKSIFGGVFISIGAFTYISTGMAIIGAILFAFGLITVILTNSNLFTGKSGFCDDARAYLRLIPILLLNVVGCFIVGYIASDSINTDAIISKRLDTGYLQILLLSVCTGMIMTISVKYAKFEKQWLPLLFGVPTFIVCGMPHCIADVFYYAVYIFTNGTSQILAILIVWLISVVGNFIGCVAPRLLWK